MNRRHFLALAGCLAGGAGAQADNRLAVVKVLNFSCPVCRASEIQDLAIRKALESRGGVFRSAPVPSVPPLESAWRELAYYALRDAADRPFEQELRRQLYAGSQDLSLTFATPVDVATFLENTFGVREDWSRLQTLVYGLSGHQGSLQALQRAVTLAGQAGVEALPGYLVLQGPTLKAALDAPNHGNNSLLGLQQTVLKTLDNLKS